MVPLVQITWEKKAPSFTSIDNIEEKLRDYYGKIYTDPQLYQVEVLDVEKNLPKYGTKLCEIESSKGKKFSLHKASITEPTFQDRQFYMQAILTFFIDGASIIDVNQFWKYFLLYDQESGNIAGFISAYQAHKNAVEYRTKVSQVFVYMNYQR